MGSETGNRGGGGNIWGGGGACDVSTGSHVPSTLYAAFTSVQLTWLGRFGAFGVPHGE